MTLSPYILLVEDNAGDARLTRTLLEESGHAGLPPLCWVQSAEAAIRTLQSTPGCEAILLDLGLPDQQGMESLRAVKPYATHCPILVLTGDDDEALGMDAVVAGAQDYLIKGRLDAGLLRRCIGFAAQRQRAEQALLARALHDDLTGLPRRALLLDRLQEALKRSQRAAADGALLFVDVDRFKHINDTHGHAAGDAVLCSIGQRLRDGLRSSDTVARMGGDEFVVLLPNLPSANDAVAVGHKLLAAVAVPLPFNGASIAVSVSVGVAGFSRATETAEQLLQRADAAMYAAKSAGRGRVCLL